MVSRRLLKCVCVFSTSWIFQFVSDRFLLCGNITSKITFNIFKLTVQRMLCTQTTLQEALFQFSELHTQEFSIFALKVIKLN